LSDSSQLIDTKRLYELKSVAVHLALLKNILIVSMPILLVLSVFSNVPEASAQANANLFVSAEDSRTNNYFWGPMVIEVRINDSDISNTNGAVGEPDVTVNGKILRMIQATNGDWYAYFADRVQAQIADSTSVSGDGLDFGSFCDRIYTIVGFDVSDTVGIAVNGLVAGGIQGTDSITKSKCEKPPKAGSVSNVVEKPPDPNPGNGDNIAPGQIGLETNAWPFIQLYDFAPTSNVVIQYNKGGGAQTVTLIFDIKEEIEVNYEDLRPQWKLADTKQELKRDDIIIELENLDRYFSTVKNLEATLEEIKFPIDRYEVENFPTYKNKELVFTKKITIDIINSEEYNDIFEKNIFDVAPSSFLVKFPDEIIDENVIDQYITSALKLCQQNSAPAYCNEDAQSLKDQIFSNIGRHVVTESLVLIQNTVEKKDSYLEDTFISSLIDTKENENNIGLTSDHSLPVFPPTNIDVKNYLIPDAMAQSISECPKEVCHYLNGFTKGFGTGKTWSYDYKVLGFPVFFAEARIEAGLGIGLRIPIDVTVETQKVTPQSSSGVQYDASYQVFTKNLTESEYSDLGLPLLKTFEGYEFKMYVGPAGYIQVKLFGVTVFEPSIGVTKPEGKNFTPPIGKNKKESFDILDVNLCDVGFPCLPPYIGKMVLSAGMRGDLSADKITIDSTSISSSQSQLGIPFTYNGDKKDSQHPISSENILENVKYYSNLDFAPELKVKLDSPYIPFPLIDETLELPGIKFTNIIFGAHNDTVKEFVIPEFGPIVIMILGIAIAIIVAVMARSKVVTRFEPIAPFTSENQY